MIPNPNVYGTPEEWILASYDMPEAYLAAWGVDSIDRGKLSTGVTENKIKLKEVLDQSIGYVGMGRESVYSNIITINSSGQIVTDSRPVTNFFYAYGEPITYDYYIPNDNSAYTWDVDSLSNDNYNGIYRPIVSFNPKRLLWHVMVTVSDAKVNGALYTTGLNAYHSSAVLQSQYPYLKMAFMYPLINNSNTDTPHWINTLTEPMHLCINDKRKVENFDFITFNDLKITSAYYRGGILLRGSIEGIGNTFISNTHCVYMLGDTSSIEMNGAGYYVYAELYDNNVCDEILKAAACFCNYFVGTNPWPVDWETTALNSDTVFLGYPDDNGVSHGDYTIGSDNETNPVWNWSQSSDNKYDYSKVDPNTYEHETPLPNITNLYATPYNVYYDGSGNHLKNIVASIASLDPAFYSLMFIGQEPLSNIIGARRVFMKSPTHGNTTTIKLGAYDTEIASDVLIEEVKRIEIGSKLIYPIYDNFMDYEPYTTISLYVPYCGSLKLPTSIFMGHYCKLTINANTRTGDLDCIVFVDNIEFATLKGCCAFDMAVSGLAMSEYAQRERQIQYAIEDNSMQMLSSTFGHVAGATISGSFGNAGGIAMQLGMAAIDLEKAFVQNSRLKFELNHIAPNCLLIQKSSANVSPLNVLQPFIFIERPVFEAGYNEEKYAKTVGHTCYRIGNLSEFKGLTVCADAVLDGLTCTLKEQEMILAALQEGVILDES